MVLTAKNCFDRRRDSTDNGRRVIRSDGVEFDRIIDAAKETDCRYYNICSVCRGHRNKAGGYGWAYCDDN